jgi:hypothetical protein
LQSTISHLLAVLTVPIVLLIIAAIAVLSPTHHTEILTLLGTLAGSVVGFYFRGQHTLPKAPQTRLPKPSPPTSQKKELPKPKNSSGVDSAE